MFTLKLYRRKTSSGPSVTGPATDQKMHKVLAAHRVVVMDIGEKGRALELWAFDQAGNYESYYIGEPEEGMIAFGSDSLHLGIEPGTWWGWALLENAAGKTTEHFRPASYGIPS